MRLFVAVNVPNDVKHELKRIQGSFAEAKLKLVKEFHLTLKFLGDVAEPKVEDVIKALHKIEFRQFKTALTEVGVFPNENYVRVVWLGVKPAEFMELQKQIEKCFEGMGFRSEKKFHPHLTLARVKFIQDKELLKKVLHDIKVEKMEFEVNEFKLIRSTLTREGPIYDDLAVYKLQQDL